MVRDTAYDVHNFQRTHVNQAQFNSIEKHAQNKLLDTIFLDQLIGKYVKQNGSIVDVDDLSRFLDGKNFLILKLFVLFYFISIYIYIYIYFFFFF